jgi:hypothetical protein
MESGSRKRTRGEAGEYGTDTIERLMRERVRETIEAIVAEELESLLGARPSARTEETRRGVMPTTVATPIAMPAIVAAVRARSRLRVRPAHPPQEVDRQRVMHGAFLVGSARR